MNTTKQRKMTVSIKNNQLFLILFDFLFLVISLLLRVPPLFVCALIIWAHLVLYSVSEMKKRYALFLFLLSFFTFLLSGEIAVLYFGYDWRYVFSDSINNHTYFCLIIGLLSLFVGFCLAGKTNTNNSTEKTASVIQHKRDAIQLRQIAKWGMIITVFPYYWFMVDQALFIQNTSYVELYTDYASRLPTLALGLSELFTLFFFLYLATMPSKKKCVLPITAYMLYGVLSLLAGRRLYFGMALFIVIAYYLFRHYDAPEEQWIKKRTVFLMLAIIPLIIVFLYAYKYIRYGIAVEGNNAADYFIGFFYQQGISINILKFQKKLEGDSLGCTSLYYTLKFLRRSVITKHFSSFPISYYSSRSYNSAMYTNSLADYIYYMINPRSYLNGYGLGTCYLAELYHDGGYSLLSIISIVYGFLLNKLYDFNKGSIWKKAFALMMMEQFLILPRYGADAFLRPFYNITKLLIIFFLFVLIKYENERKASIPNSAFLWSIRDEEQ